MRQITLLSGALAIFLISATASAAQDANISDSRVEQALVSRLSFGQSVAIDGDTAVVGAPGDTLIGGSQTSLGAAYVFTRTDAGWTETAKLVATGGAPGDGFGQSVVLMGDTLVVGAPSARLAYVFTRANGTWSQTATLTPSDEVGNFGTPMALDDSTLVSGWYVFTRADDGTWSETAKLTFGDGQRFASSVDIDGDTIVVGTPAANFEQGSAYVLTRNGDTWVEAAELVASDGRGADWFGSSVTVVGNTIVVGAHALDAAYVFVDSGDTWTETAKLTPSGDAEQVDLVGETLFIRTPDAVHVFTGAGDTWTETATLTAEGGQSDITAPPQQTALDGDTLIVGALHFPDSRGAAYFFTGAGETWTETATVTVPFEQHFAEGATGVFQTDLGLFNPSDTEAAEGVITLNPETSAEPTAVPFTLEPGKRQTINVNEVMSTHQGGVSIHVESDQPVVATRQMHWDAARAYGSTLESGTPETAATWYFAEGATYFTNLFYLIANPNDAETQVTIQYLRGSGDPVTQEVVVPAQGRRTVWANEVPGLEFAEVAAVISADRPIVAERAMYFGERFDAGTTSRGTPLLSREWSFAEGETSFFDTFVVVGNPGDETAEVSIGYLLPEGGVPFGTGPYEVPPRSRRTILVDREDPRLAATSMAMQVFSSVPIVAERVMWWGPTPASWYEGHVTLGATETGTKWAIGEAASGGPAADDTYVLVGNLLSEGVGVRLTVVLDDGATAHRDFSIASLGRLTVRIQDHFPEVDGRRFSILVEHFGVERGPLVVEYARYKSTDGRFGNAGGVALATRIPD
ncbi:MAG: hypothetical protein GEV06_07735 [Luteitalea sp.]|nr:hypothetical protein [Luteitalea sp.]